MTGIRRALRWFLGERSDASGTSEDFNRRAIEAHRARGVKIGVNCRVYEVIIDGVNPHLITIGDHCRMGIGSALLAHCPIRGAHPVTIGDHVFIGFNSVILPGVSIGSVSVVGAGSVVTKSMPGRSIIAGNPARVCRPLTDEEAESLCRQLESTGPITKDGNHTM